MRDLTPKIAVKLAEAAYEIKDKVGGVYEAETLKELSKDFDFNLSDNVVQGTSGSFMEHIFKHKTGFALIGTGKKNW
ncbi:hypothetical protein KO527_24560 [Pseudoalteromonas sp. C2R02]|uniref:hypothetical protein n=1 Tax=Pseudoalteromonas sp. C2R02 TaxID=2841565 RepID=UPI001C0A4A11|nr:hypothetical protein [Pseudoalteromonas sp. C2R02]MBU2972511.1 hypothetical protein [Pseudoalteromonas sp. C2R02]